MNTLQPPQRKPPCGTQSAQPLPPAAAPSQPWRLAHVLLAPHRLGFFLATLNLIGASLWWSAVLAQRVGLLPAWPWVVSPTLAHASVMVWGFMPLYFAGFLYTAGPKWLAVPAPQARQLLGPVLLCTLAWPLFLAGASLSVTLAVWALALAATGLAALTVRFWRLIVCSPVPDRVHAQVVGVALALGVAALAAEALALAVADAGLAQRFVLAGLWACVVPVFVAVAHRMLPFFTSSALPFIKAWRPFWVLWLMLGAAALELGAVGVEAEGALPWGARMVLAVLEGAIGALLVWLAVVWGLVQSLKVRLLAMLHLGFVWLGLAFLLAGLSRGLQLVLGMPVLPLGALHALTMGCLGSLILAMVTRVSAGHSGRALVADDRVWALFWLLQLAVLLRLWATLPLATGRALLGAAALWVLVMIVWGARHVRWYGQERSDGRAG